MSLFRFNTFAILGAFTFLGLASSSTQAQEYINYNELTGDEKNHALGLDPNEYVFIDEERDSSTFVQDYIDDLIGYIQQSDLGATLVESAKEHHVKIHRDTVQTLYYGYFLANENRIGFLMHREPTWSAAGTNTSHIATFAEEFAHSFHQNEYGALWQDLSHDQLKPIAAQKRNYISEAAAKTLAMIVLYEISQKGMPTIVDDYISTFGEEHYNSKALDLYRSNVSDNSTAEEKKELSSRMFFTILTDKTFQAHNFNEDWYPEALKNSPLEVISSLITFNANRKRRRFLPVSHNDLYKFGDLPNQEGNFLEPFGDLSTGNLIEFTPYELSLLRENCEEMEFDLHRVDCSPSGFVFKDGTPLHADLISNWEESEQSKIVTNPQEKREIIKRLDRLYRKAPQLIDVLYKYSGGQDLQTAVPIHQATANTLIEYNSLLAKSGTDLPWRHLLSHPTFKEFAKQYYSDINMHQQSSVNQLTPE